MHSTDPSTRHQSVLRDLIERCGVLTDEEREELEDDFEVGVAASTSTRLTAYLAPQCGIPSPHGDDKNRINNLSRQKRSRSCEVAGAAILFHSDRLG